MKASCVDQINFDNEIVFLRIDGNVPCNKDGSIESEYRLDASLRTIEYIRQRASVLIIGTHRGRPQKDQSLEQQGLSNRALVPWFERQGLNVSFYQDLNQACQAAKQKKDQIILLENLRTFPGEQDQEVGLIESLASVVTVYVNDALSVMHRSDGSVARLPSLIAKKAYGFAVQKELKHLQYFADAPDRPFGLVIGGNKLNEKLAMVQKMIEKPDETRPAFVLLGGMIWQFFDTSQKSCGILKRVLESAKKYDVHLLVPSDYVEDNEGKIIDIGPQTIERFVACISGAHTIFCNGTMGEYEKKEGQQGTYAVLKKISELKGITVIGGGNTVDAATKFDFLSKISFVSVGGGAALTFLATEKPWSELPGLKALVQ